MSDKGKKDDGKGDELLEKIEKLKKAAEREQASLDELRPSGREFAEEEDTSDDGLLKAKEEAEEKLMRVVAEMQNLKRRSEEDKKQFAAFANQALILDILQIVQSFNLSVEHLPKDLADNEWVKGVLSIDQQLNGFLERQGVKEIECKVGDKVDPAKHEVMMKGEGKEGEVVEVFEKGYEMNGRVLRPAKVKAGGA